MLKRNAGFLRKRGVNFVPHRETRLQFTVQLQYNSLLKRGKKHRLRIDDATLRSRTKEFFEKVTKNAPDRLILSDENLAGHCGQCVRDGVLYPLRGDLMELFAREIPYPVTEVHLSIRNYADFFAAAYVEFIRSFRSRTQASSFVGEGEMKDIILKAPPRWSDTLKDVKGAFPSARLIVWRYEDFRTLEPRILQNLCGSAIDVKDLSSPKSSQSRPTASGEAVRHMLALVQAQGVQAFVEQRTEIQKQYPRDGGWGRYDPWEKHERAKLEEAYAQDWERIKHDPGFETLEPAVSEEVL